MRKIRLASYLSLTVLLGLAAGVLPEVGRMGAAPLFNTVLTFDEPLELAPGQTPGAWFPDRYAPAAFEVVEMDGNKVLRLSIDPADGAQSRPGGYGSMFYNTQGRKLDLPAGTYALAADLLFPASWQGDVRRRSDLWATAIKDTGEISFYPIAGIANNTGTPVIRYWDGADWANTDLPLVADTWYRFELEIVGEEIVVRVNGIEAGRIADANGSVALRDVIIQGYNYNDPALGEMQSAEGYDIYWDNLSWAYPEIRNLSSGTGYQTLAAAVAAAQAGEVIALAGGQYSEGPITVNKALTIQGPNVGRSGSAADRLTEASLVNTRLTLTAAAIIDGVEILQTNNTADAILIQAAATVRNTVVRRYGEAAGIVARGITTASGTVGYVIADNLFTGDSAGGFFSGHLTWNSGLWLNGGSGTVTGNLFLNCRTAINADDFNAGITITGNTFRNCGSYLSMGGTTPVSGTHTISGNEFFLDWEDPVTNWLPSALFNNSNVAVTFRLNVMENTFGGVATAELSSEQKFAIEARNYHRGRSNRQGVVDFVAHEQVVMPGTTIAGAIAAAEAGDTVRVGPGVYSETVSLSKSLRLVGAGPDVTIWRGAAITDRSLLITRDSAAPADIQVEITGFGFQTEKNQSIRATWNTSHAQALTLDIHGNRFQHANTRNPGTDFAVYVSGANQVPRGEQGGAHRIYGNEFDGVTGGLLFEYCRAVDVVGNTFKVTYEGVAFNYYGNNGVLGEQLVQGNTFNHLPVDWALAINNWHGSGNYTVLPTVIAENVFEGPGFAYAIICGVGASQSAPHEITVSRNQLKSGSITVWGDFAHQVQISATHNYWGDPTGPTVAGNPGGKGVPIPGGVGYSPWYADEGLSLLVTAASFADGGLAEGESATYEDLYIGAGSTFTVRGILTVNGRLVLAEGAVLEVIDGDLVLTGGSRLSGSFTLFNSLGSIHINDDVSIEGSADGLILVSDVHVADGATVTVEGNLVIDGSVVESPGLFTLEVKAGASFTMARTVLVNGQVEIESGDVRIYDNRIQGSTVNVASSASGARIFHNLVEDGANWLIDAGVGTVTEVDGWGNVTSPELTRNNLLLDLTLPAGLLAAKRTRDEAGNIYIQPGDSFSGTINLSALQAKVVGVELLLGYTKTLLSAETLGVTADWQEIVAAYPSSAVIGKIDAALGLSFTFSDPAGTQSDQMVADVELKAQPEVEGQTVFFQRVKLAEDTFAGDIRLTTGGPLPGSLTPFTSNSGTITIDGTVPVIAEVADHSTITQSTEDVNINTAPGAITIQGAVVIVASAFDALAGIEDASAVVTLVGPEIYTATQTAVGEGPTIDDDFYTEYTFVYDVVPATLNGTYDVVFTVTDRSGNETVRTLGTIVINKNAIAVTVELEGLETGAVRDVVFVFTDALQAVIETRTERIEFSNGVGGVVFTDVDGDTVRLSAKTDWNLRRRLDVAFDDDGQATVAFTTAADKQLLGGDLNNDNTVNMLDFAILRYYWMTTEAAADITASGTVGMTDYNILQANFYQSGDPR